MKKIVAIYDDNRIPSLENKMVTGHKSYGNTILRRRSLKDRIKDELKEFDYVKDFISFDETLEFAKEDGNINIPCVVIYSDHQVSNRASFAILLEKACYINEPFKVIDEATDNIAAVMYPTVNEYLLSSFNINEYEAIKCDAFIDLSLPSNFRKYMTSGFDARFFNELSGDEYTVVKHSQNKDKIKAEYDYYKMLPDAMSIWYASAYDYREDEYEASYRMERFHMTDLALRYVHGAISEDEFRSIMDKLFFFLKNRETKEASLRECEAEADKLYINKVKGRVSALKKLEKYAELAEYIKAGTKYEDIDEITDRYLSLYKKITDKRDFSKVLVVGHGDLCFSNILYNYEANILKLIDPRGASSKEEMYMNPYYDIAKLSHSICGNYDFFNSDQFEIVMDDHMKLSLKIDSGNNKYKEIFAEYLRNNRIDYKLIRIYEVSLFISMLPLHIDRPKKTLGFILNAINIMDEIDK